jgi:protein-S-isoprenylcysteine O-methyltransferase Ste14
MRTQAPWLLVLPFLWLAQPTPRWLAVGAAVGAVGLLIRGWAAGSIDKGRALAVSGPYAHTRHPLYLGSLVIGVGLALVGGDWIWPVAFVAFFAAVYLPTVRREAAELEARYGGEYREYATHVPACGVRLTAYGTEGQHVSSGFAWSRYLRYREWEALLGVVAVLGALGLKL